MNLIKKKGSIWVVKFHFLFIPPLFYRHQNRSCRSFHHHPCRCTFFVTIINIEVFSPFWPPPLSSFRHGNRCTFSITVINTDVATVFTPPSSSFRHSSNHQRCVFSLLLVVFLFSRVKKKKKTMDSYSLSLF